MPLEGTTKGMQRLSQLLFLIHRQPSFLPPFVLAAFNIHEARRGGECSFQEDTIGTI
jgi:hypothetical protein